MSEHPAEKDPLNPGGWEPEPIGTRMGKICWCDKECDQRPCVTRNEWWALPSGEVPAPLGEAHDRAFWRAVRELIREGASRVSGSDPDAPDQQPLRSPR